MNRRKAIRNTGLIAGATVLVPSFLTIFQSCKSDVMLTYQPLFFTEEEAKFIAKLVDVILPRTDTPGALDVKADIFMDIVFAKTNNAEQQQNTRADIAKFNEDCKKNFGAVFIDLDKNQQVEVLKAAEASDGKFNKGVWGTAVGQQEPVGFYRSIKSMAIWVYMTSRDWEKCVEFLSSSF